MVRPHQLQLPGLQAEEYIVAAPVSDRLDLLVAAAARNGSAADL